MAKSVLALLAVLAAVSLLHAAPAAALPNFAGAVEWMGKANPAELSGKIGDAVDVAQWFIDLNQLAGDQQNDAYIDRGGSSTPVTVSSGLYHVTVTGITVGGKALSLGSTLDNVLLPAIPFTFLNKDAYDLVKGAFTVKPVTSLNGAKFGQLCYPAGTETVPITLVFDGGAKMNVAAEDLWYKQGDGSMCLAILASPLEAGTTILGSMLLKAGGTSYDSAKKTLTFQTSIKAATATGTGTRTGTGTSSKSNTAAATKPSLALWVLLLLLIILS